MKWTSIHTASAVLAIAYLVSSFAGQLLENHLWFGGVVSMIGCLLLTPFIINEHCLKQGHQLLRNEACYLLLFMALIIILSELLYLPFSDFISPLAISIAIALKLVLVSLGLVYQRQLFHQHT